MGLIYDPFLGRIRYTWSPGAGIDMSGGTISVITPPEGVPYVAGPGVGIYGATIYGDYQAGYRMEIDGATIGQQRYFPIETVSSNSVTLQAGHAYKVYATSAAITLNAEPIPANSFGLEGYLEIFVGSTGYIVTGTNVVLANALEHDAVNNCTVRFHDGLAIISVEDHVAGYIVVSATGSTAGTLPYALGSASQEYIAFDASLNGTTVDLAGATTYAGEKHVVGNGYAETIISGGITCTSKTTFSNLSMDGVVASGGTMTLGDVYIPSGATVAVNGGGLAVEKVNADGGTIDLGGTRSVNSSPFDITSCTITNGGSDSVSELGAIQLTTVNSRFATISGCLISGNITRGIEIYGGGNMNIVSCVFSGNMASYGAAFALQRTHNINSYVNFKGCTIKDNTATNTVFINNNNPTGFSEASFEDCTIAENQNIRAVDALDKLVFKGSNTLKGTVTGSGTVTLTSGAIVDLTGNMNATPINPGVGIIINSGVQVRYDSGGLGSELTARIDAGTFATIGNDGTFTMAANVYLPAGGTIQNVKIPFNGTYVIVAPADASAYITDCTIPRTGTNGGTLVLSGDISLTNTIVAGGLTSGCLKLADGCKLIYTSARNAVTTIPQLIIGSGCSVVTFGGTTVPLDPDTYENKGINSNGVIQ